MRRNLLEAGKRLGIGILRPLGLGAIALLAGLVLVLGSGGMYQTTVQSNRWRTIQLPGRLIPVSGRNIYLDCHGIGNPTLVLEGGATAFAATWDLLMEKLATRMRVCAYDRAGLGWSEEAGSPREPRDAATDLHETLVLAGERAPYIVVGHSLGAMFAILFAEKYHSELQGLVLIDPPHPEMFRVVPYTNQQYHALLHRLLFGELLTRVGVLDAFAINGPLIQMLPPSARGQATYVVNDPKHLRNSRLELLMWPSIARAVAAASAYRSLPVLVVCPTEPLDSVEGARIRSTLTRLQAAYVTPNPHSSQLELAGAGHVSVLLKDAVVSELADHVIAFARETLGPDISGRPGNPGHPYSSPPWRAPL